ncbi:hypothetical protein KP509_34G065400, partial [Ceratopteris richardii]
DALNGGRRLLGLDVGVKHLGVAISDAECRIARTSRVIKDNVAGFVVGYPVSIAGLWGLQTVKVDEFVSRLRNTEAFEGLVYSWEDERFTSQVVASMLKDYDINPLILKHISDKFSAVNILQACLDRLNRLAREMSLFETMY